MSQDRCHKTYIDKYYGNPSKRRIFPATFDYPEVSKSKKGLRSEGLLMIDLVFVKGFFVIELYKGCWQVKMS